MHWRAIERPPEDDVEKNLAWSVFDDSIRLLEEAAQRHPLLHRRGPVAEAYDWVMASDAEWPMSFDNVCGSLGVDPSEVRAEVGSWFDRPPRTPRRSGTTRLPTR